MKKRREIRSRRPTLYVFRGSLPRGNRGWMVQVPGKRAKFFSDIKNGGRSRAMAAAKRHARQLVDRARVNPETGRWVHKKPTSGVFRFMRADRPGGPAVWIAIANIEPGKTKRRYFSARKYGEKEARRLARLARAEMVKRILGSRWTR